MKRCTDYLNPCRLSELKIHGLQRRHKTDMSQNNPIQDDIFEFIFGGALRDAVMRKAYVGEKPKVSDFSSEVLHQVRIFANKVLTDNFHSQDEYDKLFFDLALNIKTEVNSKKKNGNWNFGNSQKLINMIIKNLFVICYIDNNQRKRFQFCHCPLDSILLGIVKQKTQAKRLNDTQHVIFNSNRINWGVPWSKEDCDTYIEYKKTRYCEFQKIVRVLAAEEGLYSLEYDYHVWKHNYRKHISRRVKK